MAISEEEIKARKEAGGARRPTRVSDAMAALLAEQARERTLFQARQNNEQIDLLEKHQSAARELAEKEAAAAK